MIYIQRSVEGKLLAALKQFSAIAISGPRQTGKSTLLKHLLSRTHQYITFDDPLIRERAISDPKLFLEGISDFVIFDEIQYVPQLTSYIKIKIDESRALKGRYIFTGSQQFPMLKSLGDTLAGRVAILNLLPFSNYESALINEENTLSALDEFKTASLRGMYPELQVVPGLDHNLWYASYLQTYLERDVRGLNNIGNLRDFQQFMRLMAVRCSQVLNMSQLSNELNIALNTIKKWISVLETSQIIYLLRSYHTNFGKQITKSPKIYFTDIGFACYLAGVKDPDHLMNGPMSGACFENHCIQEILKHYYNQGAIPQISYIRTNNELEIDLLIEVSGQEIIPVEIKLSKTPTTKMLKPIERIRSKFPKLPLKKAVILCLSDDNYDLTRDARVCNPKAFIKSL